jgi:hypothetical protein
MEPVKLGYNQTVYLWIVLEPGHHCLIGGSFRGSATDSWIRVNILLSKHPFFIFTVSAD